MVYHADAFGPTEFAVDGGASKVSGLPHFQLIDSRGRHENSRLPARAVARTQRIGLGLPSSAAGTVGRHGIGQANMATDQRTAWNILRMAR